MRRKILPFILGGALSIAAIAPTAAAPPTTLTGGAIGLVNVVVQAVVQNIEILNNSEVDVITVQIDDSLNNLLRGANIQILQDVLNNSLNNLDLDVTIQDIQVVNGDIVVNVLGAGGTVDTIIFQ
jgi:hypothetical protein